MAINSQEIWSRKEAENRPPIEREGGDKTICMYMYKHLTSCKQSKCKETTNRNKSTRAQSLLCAFFPAKKKKSLGLLQVTVEAIPSAQSRQCMPSGSRRLQY